MSEPLTFSSPTISTGAMGSSRAAYYTLREAFKEAMDGLPAQLSQVPSFYHTNKTYFLLRRHLYSMLFAMKEQDRVLVLEWVKRHWPEGSRNRVLQDLGNEAGIDYTEEMVEDLRAAWRLNKESWQAKSAAMVREETDLAHSRISAYLSMDANFLNPRATPPTEKEIQRMAINTFANRRYKEQITPFIKENGVRFASLLRRRPSVACKLLMTIESPAIQAAMLSRRENPDGCLVLRDVMLEMQTGKGEMILPRFLETFFTIETTRSMIEASRRMPLYYIADALLDAGLYTRAQELLRIDNLKK